MFVHGFLFLKFSRRGKLSAGVSSLSKQKKQKKTELVIKTSPHLKWGNLTSLFSAFPKVLLSGLTTAIAGKIVLRQRSENRPGSLNLKGCCAQTNSNRRWNALAGISPPLLAFTQRLNGGRQELVRTQPSRLAFTTHTGSNTNRQRYCIWALWANSF